MQRTSGIAFGVATHILFAGAVFLLFRFLEATDRGHANGSWLVDSCRASYNVGTSSQQTAPGRTVNEFQS
jgi:hypothetical protein